MRLTPQISFCVTAHDCPGGLQITLGSLVAQRDVDYEILVGINSTDPSMTSDLLSVCQPYESVATVHLNNEVNCYYQSELLASNAFGEYLCFPSEEDYYMPTFGQRMLTQSPVDLIICNCVYDYEHDGQYKVLHGYPSVGLIDKGGFLIKRELFQGFPAKQPNVEPSQADGIMIAQFVRTHSWTSLQEVLWVHN